MQNLADICKIELSSIPQECVYNAHMFYAKAEDIEERTKLINYLKESGILTVFHYISLHTSPAGKKFGRFNMVDKCTTKEGERLLRLPMYYRLEKNQVEYIIDKIQYFYR